MDRRSGQGCLEAEDLRGRGTSWAVAPQAKTTTTKEIIAKTTRNTHSHTMCGQKSNVKSDGTCSYHLVFRARCSDLRWAKQAVCGGTGLHYGCYRVPAFYQHVNTGHPPPCPPGTPPRTPRKASTPIMRDPQQSLCLF